MYKSRRVALPKNKYISQIEVNDDHLLINYKKRKKVAVLFVSLNPRYWPYLANVLDDVKKHFLPQHNVECLIWSEMEPDLIKKTYGDMLKDFESDIAAHESATTPEAKLQAFQNISARFLSVVREFERIVPDTVKRELEVLGSVHGLTFKYDENNQPWFTSTRQPDITHMYGILEGARRILGRIQQRLIDVCANYTIFPTEAIEWPAPTLMRYHLFLGQEEKLKEYDHLFYLDADMKIVDKISDEIINDGLLAAEHPMYSLRREYIPPYEPNKKSAAYMPRLGTVVTENDKPRFKTYYVAGGFQGGTARAFIKAMKVMKANIDKDFHNNYTAIWNDESHWNRYLLGYDGELTVLSPAYVYPDSLIKEYYEKIWGCSYEPKIITITKPFSLSRQGGSEINQFMKSS